MFQANGNYSKGSTEMGVVEQRETPGAIKSRRVMGMDPPSKLSGTNGQAEKSRTTKPRGGAWQSRQGSLMLTS